MRYGQLQYVDRTLKKPLWTAHRYYFIVDLVLMVIPDPLQSSLSRSRMQ